MATDLIIGGGTGAVGGNLGAKADAAENADLRRRVTELADSQKRPPKEIGDPRTVAMLKARDGFHPGRSGQDLPEKDPLAEVLAKVPKQGAYHGYCAELDALRTAIHAGDEVVGGKIMTAKVRGYKSDAHGSPHEPCDTCASVLDQLGISYLP